MKKIISGISLVAFLLFGVANVPTVVADQQGNDIVVVDKDPDKDKDKDKKAKKTADAKTADKKASPDAKKDCAVKSDCKTAKKTSCCAKSHPDKK